jgi:hypothetical protein
MGESQLDYLRRLAREITRVKMQDSDLEIKAIGVLGSDVYDKLLILQALRKEFPSAIFFTTDLDARFLHPDRYAWTRNLVVGSSYGFRLSRRIQGCTIPPFRDSYQTSLFCSVLAALEYPFTNLARIRCLSWLIRSDLCKNIRVFMKKIYREFLHNSFRDMEPRLFEVGRSGAYDITPRANHSYLHPDRPQMKLDVGSCLMISCAFILFLLLLFPVSSRLRRIFYFENPRTISLRKLVTRERLTYAMLFILLILTVLLFSGTILNDSSDGTGEPFAFCEGISIWPSEMIRLLGAYLSIYLFCSTSLLIAYNNLKIETDFGLKGESLHRLHWRETVWLRDQGMVEHLHREFIKLYNTSIHITMKAGRLFKEKCKSIQKHGLKKTVKSFLVYRTLISITNWRSDLLEPSRIDNERYAPQIWKDYLYRGRIHHRFIRFLPVGVVYYAFGILIMNIFGFPHVPYRGDVSDIADFIIIQSSVILMILFTFFVVDATRLCHRFVLLLTGGPARWPDTDNDTSEWLSIKLVADRTRVIGRLILFPFVIYPVMIISRISLFDNWDWPLSLILVISLTGFIAIGCTFALRRTAENARHKALGRLWNHLVKVRDSTDDDEACGKHIEWIMDKMESLQEGAFSPLSQNPIIAAILMPLGGLGILAVVELLAVY